MGPQHISRWQPRLLLTGLLMLVGFGAMAVPAVAQGEVEEPSTVTTWVRLCLEPGCTEQLELTETVDGVPVEVTDTETGDVLGSCATGDLEPGACSVDVTGVASVTIAIDEATLPAGYVVDGNPATIELEAGVGAEMPFLLFPEGGFPEEPGDDDGVATPVVPDDDVDDTTVSGLPATGTGTTSGESGWDIGTVSIAALVTMTLGIAAFGGRALMSQRR